MYTVHQAKTNLSRLIAEAGRGSEVIIARGKQPVAKLIPLVGAGAKRTPGRLKGEIRISRAFYKPMTMRELAGWGMK